ncbi:hypothetical protein EPN81_00640 [Patescibacteria group bacterium]|nr:MAG: hypothetical protein EPN81_00640 [Patescibacteria group bacterium]
MPKLTTGQIGQLIEIDHAHEHGIGSEVQELINRLTSGGVAGKITDPRAAMAKRLWDRGFGRDEAVKTKNFKSYLQGIPQIPASMLVDDPELPFLSLADPRSGLLRICKLLGIKFEELGYTDGDAEPFDGRFILPIIPFWFRHDGGRKNRNLRPDHCRDEQTGDTLVGTAVEGLFAFAHHPEIVKEGEHIIDLPGTVLRGRRVSCACLRVWGGQTQLHLHRHSDVPSPDCGSLCVRRK